MKCAHNQVEQTNKQITRAKDVPVLYIPSIACTSSSFCLHYSHNRALTLSIAPSLS